jgi:hypothetical protein
MFSLHISYYLLIFRLFAPTFLSSQAYFCLSCHHSLLRILLSYLSYSGTVISYYALALTRVLLLFVVVSISLHV